MKNTRLKNARFFLAFAAPVLLFFAAASCSTEGDIQRILGKSIEAPVFLECRPVSSAEVIFKFSRPVRVVSLNFTSGLETAAVEEGSEVKISFARPLDAGQKITADILVEDADRNSLNVIVPFRARNDRLPPLYFNELKPEVTKPKSEFVEFFAAAPGNLGALRLFIAGYSLDEPVYEFPPAEVKAGEYIVLHLRTRDEKNWADETGEDLALSGGVEADENARDFWIPGDKKLLHETEILWLLDQDDRIVDAVMLSGKPAEGWKKNNIAAAEFLGRNNAWFTTDGNIPTASDAVFAAGATSTRSICRDETVDPPERRAGNWYVSASRGDSPGKRNGPRPK